MADGADGIEFDVRLSRDQVAVVIHDASLRRTGLRSGLVEELTAAELRLIDVGSWFSHAEETNGPRYSGEGIPLLTEVLDLFNDLDALLYLEMKCDRGGAARLAAAVVTALRGRSITERVIIECFDLSALEEVRRRAPHLRTAALFEPKLRQPISLLQQRLLGKLAKKSGAIEVALHHSLARRRAIESARQNDLEVVVWTVDTPDWVSRARAMDLKALITNDPAAMIHWRDQAGNSIDTGR
jgi:glycerophosphoryl diester phosphodiesterase